MEKVVSQLDENGYFVGATVADESPLEPGVFLIPGGAIDMVPPAEIRPGKRYRAVGDKWMPEDLPAPELEADPPQSIQVTSVSRFQALAALMQAGLLDDVTAWANDPGTDALHKLAFDTAAEFSRSSPTLAAGAAALGWSEGQLDDLFAAASQIQA